MDTNDIFSFKSIRNLISQFRQVNKYDGNRLYDEPGTFFWKPIFYFYNGDSESNSIGLGNSGLLYPSWITNPEYKIVDDNSNDPDANALCENPDAINDAQLVNCAYNYLLRNNELKRAALLKNFIELLSDISSKTPWYFREITGLEDAVSKKSFFESPKIEETRKQITITCLADSIDTRIGNMLDMYRSACYSWQTKRVIVPANLRKFDMGIYVFLRPYQHFYNEDEGILNSSHKYLEFHNCEIDIDSCKIGDTFNNDTASQIEYKIVISYDNCYDNRYSDFHNGLIGDAIMTDVIANDYIFYDADNIHTMQYKYKDYGYMANHHPNVDVWQTPIVTIGGSQNNNIEELKKTALKQPLDLELSRDRLWDEEEFYGENSDNKVYDFLIKSESSASKRLLKNLMLEQSIYSKPSKNIYYGNQLSSKHKKTNISGLPTDSKPIENIYYGNQPSIKLGETDISEQPTDSKPIKNIYYGERVSKSRKQSNMLTRAVDNVIDATVGTAKQALRSGVGGFLLGNLYHGSIVGSLMDIRQGRLISGTKGLVDNLTNEETYERPVKNIYGTIKSETVDKIKKSAKSIKSLGNLNSNKTARNNL